MAEPPGLREAMAADKTIVTDYIHPHSLNDGIPTTNILPPKVGGVFSVDDAVLEGSNPPVVSKHLSLPHF
jgi:hypothetical protein